MARPLARPLHVIVLAISLVNASPAHAAMPSVMRGATPFATWDASHETPHHHELCLAGAHGSPCAPCAICNGSFAATVTDAAALAAIAAAPGTSAYVAGRPGVRFDRGNRIRAPPRTSIEI